MLRWSDFDERIWGEVLWPFWWLSAKFIYIVWNCKMLHGVCKTCKLFIDTASTLDILTISHQMKRVWVSIWSECPTTGKKRVLGLFQSAYCLYLQKNQLSAQWRRFISLIAKFFFSRKKHLKYFLHIHRNIYLQKETQCNYLQPKKQNDQNKKKKEAVGSALRLKQCYQLSDKNFPRYSEGYLKIFAEFYNFY
jgi:hypothetical protein